MPPKARPPINRVPTAEQTAAATQYHGASAKPGGRNNPLVPYTRGQYEALANGTYYIASDGTFSRKGNALSSSRNAPPRATVRPADWGRITYSDPLLASVLNKAQPRPDRSGYW